MLQESIKDLFGISALFKVIPKQDLSKQSLNNEAYLFRADLLHSFLTEIQNANSAFTTKKFMDLKNTDVKRFLKTLAANEVKYMIVGGMATIYHGHVRSTMDLDLWIKDSPENKRKLVLTLKEMEVPGADLYQNMDLVPGWSSLTIGEEGFEADLMGYMKAFKEADFEKVYQRSLTAKLDGILFRVINIDDLIKEKKANGRPKDLDDIKGLMAERGYNGIEVTTFSKSEFLDLLQDNSITAETVEQFSEVMFISILDTGKTPILPNSKNYLNLIFDDVEKDIIGIAKTLSNEVANELNAFLKINKTKKRCYIHCSAGVSRSGSVGKYIVDELKGDLTFFKRENPKINVKRHFLKILEEAKRENP